MLRKYFKVLFINLKLQYKKRIQKIIKIFLQQILYYYFLKLIIIFITQIKQVYLIKERKKISRKQDSNKKMLEKSYISDRKISKSMTRLNKISSDKKFRVKSLRMKTQQKSQQTSQSPTKKALQFPSIIKQRTLSSSSKKLDHLASITSTSNLQTSLLLNNKLKVKSTILIEKDYQQQLMNKFFIQKDFLQQLFILKLQQDQIKPTQQKYIHFCKTFYLRLFDKIELNIEGFNFKNKALEKFLNFFINWNHNKDIISLDLSFCSQLAREVKSKEQEEQERMKTMQKINTQSSLNPNEEQQPLWPRKNILTRLILQSQRLTKVVLRNMHISPEQMLDLLTCCLRSKRIYSLDISNKNSQSINRIGTQYYYIEAFFAKNQHVGVIKMDNLNLTDDCIQKISKGINQNLANNPLKILSLSSNFLTQKSLNHIYSILKSGITELNLSNNPLGPQFFMEIKNLRASTVRSLDLSQTGMNSQSLIHFLQQITQNKNLQICKLDNNDFSHHWFNKIKDIFESGLSIKSISFVNCGIKNFDTLFQGLSHTKCLKKLNLNYNLVNIQQQQIDKVSDCLKSNKSLQQIRIRFCGYNQPILTQLIQSLKSNKSLEFFDISQNHLSDNGAKLIIKILNQNKKLKYIGTQKLQLTVRMCQQIQRMLLYNRQVRQKQQFNNLIYQNKIYKAKDNFTWKDIEDVQHECRRIEVFIKQALNKNQKLENKIEKKKNAVLELRKQLKQEEKKRDKQLKRAEQQVNSALRKIYEDIDRFEQLENTALQSLQIQQNLIKALQTKIMKQNQKIKKRQNQLQNQLRDQKYLNRKRLSKDKLSARDSVKGNYQQQIKQKKQKDPSNRIFDNTKGLTTQSKRKNSTNEKKKT